MSLRGPRATEWQRSRLGRRKAQGAARVSPRAPAASARVGVGGRTLRLPWILRERQPVGLELEARLIES